MTTRLPLELKQKPSELLLALRHASGLVGLLGPGWQFGQALIAFEPVRVLPPHADPFAVLNSIDGSDVDGDGFGGGWLGYWGYDLLHHVEQVPQGEGRAALSPTHALGYYDRALRLVGGTWWAEGSCAPAELEDWVDRLNERTATPSAPRPFTTSPFEPDRSPLQHQEAVSRALTDLRNGEIFQVNLATTLRASYRGDPLDAFCVAFDRLKPAFGAYVSHETGAVASLSPELFLRRNGRALKTSPIKGTAPRGAGKRDDRERRDTLLASAKDRAENTMIVDLMRNDLARVCQSGSVTPGPIRAEPHAVWHLVSDVTGRLREGLRDGDLLRATFPPGSVTGAPKVAAMHRIAAYEVADRGAYTGAIGASTTGLGLELNVAIRTLEFDHRRQQVGLGVGGGIVIGSEPAREWSECIAKAAPVLQSIGSDLRLPADKGTAPSYNPDDVDEPKPGSDGLPSRLLASRRRTAHRETLRSTAPRLLLLDNYDSFVHNLADYAERLGASVVVIRSDSITPAELLADRRAGRFSHLLISPGPGTPATAGISVEAVRSLGRDAQTPILGICLGHQAIVEAYGGTIGLAPQTVHGRSSEIHHGGHGIWRSLPAPVTMGRYHSLVATHLPDVLRLTAGTSDGLVMGVQHRSSPVFGVQPHPESVLSDGGLDMIASFLTTGPTQYTSTTWRRARRFAAPRGTSTPIRAPPHNNRKSAAPPSPQ